MKKMNESEPLMNCRKRRDGDQKQKESLAVISSEETCLLTERSPALRWHDFYTGSYKERGNQFSDAKETVQVGNPCKNLSTNAGNWDGVTRISDESSVMEWERRGHIFSSWNKTIRRKLRGSK